MLVWTRETLAMAVTAKDLAAWITALDQMEAEIGKVFKGADTDVSERALAEVAYRLVKPTSKALNSWLVARCTSR